MRPDWDKIMYEIVFAKFTQNTGPRKELFRIGDKTLVEHTKNDSYWADGGDGSGRNQLGKTLMAIRDIVSEMYIQKKTRNISSSTESVSYE